MLQIQQKWVVKYTVGDKRYGYDCSNPAQAAIEAADIGIYEGVEDIRIEFELNSDMKESPYIIK